MQTAVTGKFAESTRVLLGELFKDGAVKDVRFRLWDGTCWPDEQPRPATVVLKHPGALRSMFLPGTEVALGEAYLFDDFDVEGDFEAAFALRSLLTDESNGVLKKLRAARELLQLPAAAKRQKAHRGRVQLKGRRHSVERDREAVGYHYNISNDFYALWLDENLVYSCAYFQSADDSLDHAQEQKLDYICRKLRLKPGQRLLDVGCGWGALVMHAARSFGVDATGITLSQAQVELARERIEKAGLSDRCRVRLADYREMDKPDSYDALASVGMFEHVGAKLLPSYFSIAWKLLKPGGVFLNQGIARRHGSRNGERTSFTANYVFPDGELVPVSTTLTASEEAGFEVRDVESLREHYALTLRHWVRRLEDHHEDALQYVDEPAYRVWRLFMAGSAYGFRTGNLSVLQSLLLKPSPGGKSFLPLTRSDCCCFSNRGRCG